VAETVCDETIVQLRQCYCLWKSQSVTFGGRVS